MERVLVLIDLSNTTVFRGVHRPNPALIGARLDEFLTGVVDRAYSVWTRTFREFVFRLYDGWFDGTGTGTQLYELLRFHLRSAYPTRKRLYRVFVELAEAPLASRDGRLLDTFRQYPGLTRHHIAVVADPPVACHSPAACGIAHLRSWIRGNCPVGDCSVASTDAAHFRQQKLIDACLVADAIWGASQGQEIVVVTDDEDVIPGLITARWFGSPITWACRSTRPRSPYDALITRHGIGYLPC
jgi:hypothetical protein